MDLVVPRMRSRKGRKKRVRWLLSSVLSGDRMDGFLTMDQFQTTLECTIPALCGTHWEEMFEW
jgi:hypothetical protein